MVENKRSQRPDSHALLLLDELFPNHGCDIITAADHDQIWLGVEDDDISKLTDEQILELVRCGVWYDSDLESLSMIV